MKIIVAVDKNWGIGRGNSLLFSVPADMKHFRDTTQGKVVAYGRRTLESFPDGKPLAGRTNVVLSGTASVSGACVCRDLPSFLRVLGGFCPDDVYICGGETVYRQLLPYCSEAVVTKIDAVGDADAFFPNLDRDEGWREVSVSKTALSGGYAFRIAVYKNLQVRGME